MGAALIPLKQEASDPNQAHSRHGPSSSDRWLNCLGSVKYTENMADKPSRFAAEGTAAHTLSEWARVEGKPAKHYIGKVLEVDGFVFTVDTDMAHGVQRFVDYADRLPGDPFYEVRVHYTAFVPDGWGTADDVRVDVKEKVCYVTDLKFGKGIQVFADNNPQLKLYALGVYQEYGHLYDIDRFVLAIHQPRLDHVDEWGISVEELLAWTREVVVPAAEAGMKEGAPFTPGKWCGFCPAKDVCPTRNNFMQELYLNDLSDVENPAPEELGAILDRIELIRSWCNDKEKLGKAMIAKGTPPIGEKGEYKIVEGRSSRGWTNEDEAVKAMKAAKLKNGDIYTMKVITAPAAEKLLGKKHEIFNPDLKLVSKPQGKPVMVPFDDPRPSLQVNAEDEFDDLDSEE